MTPSFGSIHAFLAASSWQALPAPQGRTSSLRCGRSTLTYGSSPAIRQQPRKGALQDRSSPHLRAWGHFEPTSDVSDLGWGHFFKPSEWVHLEAS